MPYQQINNSIHAKEVSETIEKLHEELGKYIRTDLKELTKKNIEDMISLYMEKFGTWLKDDKDGGKTVIEKHHIRTKDGSIEQDSNGQPKIYNYYVGLNEGIYLLETFRKVITGSSIKYIITTQSKSDFLNIEKNNLDKPNIVLVEGEDLLLNMSSSKNNFQRERRVPFRIADKIIKEKEKIKKEGESLCQEANYLNSIKEKIKKYKSHLVQSKKKKYVTYYYDEKLGQKTISKKVLLKEPKPYMEMTELERWKMWVDQKNWSKDLSEAGKYYKEKIYQKREKEITFYAEKNKNFYQITANAGQLWEALLYGGSFDRINKTVDDILIETTSNTVPFYSGADVYIKIKNEEGLNNEIIQLQAKARGATIKGDTTYNAINDIYNEYHKLNGDLKNFGTYLVDKLIDPKNNPEVIKTEKNYLTALFQKIDKEFTLGNKKN